MTTRETTGFYIEIRPFTEDETDGGFVRMHSSSRHNAEKIERGANINLNHEKYYTKIIDRAALSRLADAKSEKGT